MAKHLFIINPTAGGAAGYPSIAARIIELAGGMRLDYDLVITDRPGHAVDITREAAERSDDLRVYVCGGDGSLNEAVNGAAGGFSEPGGEDPVRGVAIAHIPIGTGNDFVRCFGQKEDFHDLEALINGRDIPLDLIEIDTGEQKRYAVNICSVGVDANVASGADRFKWSLRWGSKMPYNLSLVTTTVAGVKRPYTVTVDGRLCSSEESGVSKGNGQAQEKYTILTCCNGQVYGGGFKACPDADPMDGRLEFLLVKGVSRLTLTRIIGTYSRGGYKDLARYIKHTPGRSMTVESDKPFNINYDGEVARAKRVEFSLSPRKLRFILPARIYDRLPCAVPAK